MDLTYEILKSWKAKESKVNPTSEIIKWINELNRNTYVNICETSIDKDTFWFYDDYKGEILNRKRSFFSVIGMREFVNDKFVREQPVIVQPEIGYLGIICKQIDGVLHFLMQAKIEPGNINCVQISPTIQATKSNFTRAHGGNLPTYFEMFEHSEKYNIVYDQIQSEQAGRFYKKRNRNMIMIVDEDIVVYKNFKWMTLGQIKELMNIDNLVNMDTRTVLSGIPFFSGERREEYSSFFSDFNLYNSMFNYDGQYSISKIYKKINDYKMFNDVKTKSIPLYELNDWNVDEYGVTCQKDADFMVRFYNVEISGREVQKWSQPMFKALGMATFGLITKIENNKRIFLIRIKHEIGTFDKVEIGPSVQWESTHNIATNDIVEDTFTKYVDIERGVLKKVTLSEEGGRFYHEQNCNVILEIDGNELTDLPEGYVWTDFSTLNRVVQINNCLNIQIRNLLSLLDL